MISERSAELLNCIREQFGPMSSSYMIGILFSSEWNEVEQAMFFFKMYGVDRL